MDMPLYSASPQVIQTGRPAEIIIRRHKTGLTKPFSNSNCQPEVFVFPVKIRGTRVEYFMICAKL